MPSLLEKQSETSSSTQDRSSLIERRYAREKKARFQAEKLLEDKSRELYLAQESLEKRHEELHEKYNELEMAQKRITSLARFPEENPYPVLRILKTGKVIYRNPSAKKLSADWQPQNRIPDLWMEQVKNVIDDGQTRTIEITLNRKTIVLSIAPIEDEKYINIYATDITYRKDMERKLVQSEKMVGLGMIAAGIAHEINNPMGFLMSNLETLSTYLGPLKQLYTYYQEIFDASVMKELSSLPTGSVEVIYSLQALLKKEDFGFMIEDLDPLLQDTLDGAKRVKEIVLNLKKFSRKSNGEEFDYHDVNEGIDSTLKIVWNEVKYKAEIDKNLGEIPKVYCNIGQINQVIMNLLVNASQAMPQGHKGKIKISTSQRDQFICIRVQDNGMGIKKEAMPRLFDPFFTTKPVGQGTGLGLSVSYGIVEKHGGNIDVVSEEGQGTTFSIYLPIDGVKNEST